MQWITVNVNKISINRNWRIKLVRRACDVVIYSLIRRSIRWIREPHSNWCLQVKHVCFCKSMSMLNNQQHCIVLKLPSNELKKIKRSIILPLFQLCSFLTNTSPLGLNGPFSENAPTPREEQPGPEITNHQDPERFHFFQNPVKKIY